MTPADEPQLIATELAEQTRKATLQVMLQSRYQPILGDARLLNLATKQSRKIQKSRVWQKIKNGPHHGNRQNDLGNWL